MGGPRTCPVWRSGCRTGTLAWGRTGSSASAPAGAAIFPWRCPTLTATGAGPRSLELHVLGGRVDQVTVDMGQARVDAPVTLEAAGGTFSVVPVDVGNPHGVVFCGDPAQAGLERLGPLLETHPALGERRNIEFVSLPDRERLMIRVWERGSGITLACGTGACASFAAALRENRCERRVEAVLPGGRLTLERRGDRLFMTGPARTVFEGELPEPGKIKP